MGRQVVHEFFHDAMVRGMRIKDRRNCSLTGRKLGHGRKGKPNNKGDVVCPVNCKGRVCSNTTPVPLLALLKSR